MPPILLVRDDLEAMAARHLDLYFRRVRAVLRLAILATAQGSGNGTTAVVGDCREVQFHVHVHHLKQPKSKSNRKTIRLR